MFVLAIRVFCNCARIQQGKASCSMPHRSVNFFLLCCFAFLKNQPKRYIHFINRLLLFFGFLFSYTSLVLMLLLCLTICFACLSDVLNVWFLFHFAVRAIMENRAKLSLLQHWTINFYHYRVDMTAVVRTNSRERVFARRTFVDCSCSANKI